MSQESFVKLVSTALKASGIENGQTRIEEERVVGALKELQEFEVSADLLRKTSGGKGVKKLTKSNSVAVANAAKAVIRAWKARITTNERQAAKDFGETHLHRVESRAESGTVSSDVVSSQISDALRPGNSATDRESLTRADVSSNGLASASSLTRKNSISSAAIKMTGNRARDTARSKFEQILQREQAYMSKVVLDSATAGKEIEQAIYNQNGQSTTDEYKNKFRTLLFNLKDAKNSSLRRRILMNEVRAEQLVKLSSEELANEEKKQQNEDIRKSQLLACQRGVTQAATTDQFVCTKCRARECTYYSMQTRSADEPMTVFVTCMKCGNRWKI